MRYALSMFLLGGGLALALSRCFSPQYPACSYQCGPLPAQCPDGYECRTDGLCHLQGNNEACNFDLAPPDLTTPVAPSDSGVTDGAADATPSG